MSESILVIEDEVPMRRFLRSALSAQGFQVLEAATMREGEQAVTRNPPAAILLDLGLPDGDGIELLRRIREWSSIPIIILSARDRENEKVTALDAGADDYLTKPFGTSELLARVRVALRLARGLAQPVDPILTVGPLRIDNARHEVTVDGIQIHLTPIEFRLLALLARHAGKVLTHRQLLHEVWGPQNAHHGEYLRVHMAALRRKIESNPARPRWLTTEAGVGYRMRDS